jgi:cobalt/nickel transport system permease protein
MLGPWAGFVALSAVLVLQCLMFADGGLMALGCNILNMAAVSCLVAYPVLFRPIASGGGVGRLATASVVSSVVSLLIGALLVTLETTLSGVTALPTLTFLGFMLPIHFVIGLIEGVATALVLVVVRRADPQMLESGRGEMTHRWRPVVTFAVVVCVALVCAGWISTMASSDPDGLEWSIERTAGDATPAAEPSGLGAVSAALVENTALLPDYKGAMAGVIGAMILLVVAFVLAWIAGRAPWRRRHSDGR